MDEDFSSEDELSQADREQIDLEDIEIGAVGKYKQASRAF